ncbi:MAG: glycerophosphoryl diester phosphodiesterase membrane domain-containing protein [Patescibacteria group bacterium]
MLISPLAILKSSLELFKKHSGIFLKYSAVIFIPSFILMIVQYSLSYFILFLGNAFLAFALYLFLSLSISLASIWISLSLIKTIAKIYENQLPNFSESFNQTANSILSSIWAYVLIFLAVFGGLILFIIPGIIFAIWFSFAIQAVVLDEKKGVESLKQSKKLVEKRWWQTFWRIFIPALFFTLIIVIFEWFFALILGVKDETVLNLPTFIYLVLIMILSSFVTPFATSAMTILYLELKKNPVKKELVDESLTN